jgi:hypothetical protein
MRHRRSTIEASFRLSGAAHARIVIAQQAALVLRDSLLFKLPIFTDEEPE